MVLRALLCSLLFLPPAAADEAWDRVLLLQKIKRHIREQVGRLPDYTCLQTSERYRKDAGAKAQERLVDTVVLEVLNAGSKELYASPGDRSFHADGPGAFTATGLSGTGMFGLFLRTLFVHDNGRFEYRGEEQFRGRKTLRWDYRVSPMLSGYTVHLEFAHGTVGMRGWFLVDPETLDLLRLTVSADEIPPNLPLVTASQTVEYALTRIGDRDVMLPQNASMKLADDSGAHSRNLVEFTHCQSFRVESTLSFNVPQDGPATAALPPEVARPIGAGLVVTIELAAPLTAAFAVGALIEGRVAMDVKDRGRIEVPAGSAVRGRLRRLERDEGQWVVGIEFTEIETGAGTKRFYANLLDLDKQAGAKFTLRSSQLTLRGAEKEEVFLGYLPGVAHIFVTTPELNLPKGFKMMWKTASPQAGNR